MVRELLWCLSTRLFWKFLYLFVLRRELSSPWCEYRCSRKEESGGWREPRRAVLLSKSSRPRLFLLALLTTSNPFPTLHLFPPPIFSYHASHLFQPSRLHPLRLFFPRSGRDRKPNHDGGNQLPDVLSFRAYIRDPSGRFWRRCMYTSLPDEGANTNEGLKRREGGTRSERTSELTFPSLPLPSFLLGWRHLFD